MSNREGMTHQLRQARHIEITLRFNIIDATVLQAVAEKAIGQYGNGHEYNPNDLADCLIEALLHSNPSVPGYDDFGVELVRSDGVVS